MSLFSDLLDGPDGIYTITNRSDLVAESKLALRQATLAAHNSEKWAKDLQEIYLPLTSSQLFQLDIPTYFPNWRQFVYIRPYDSVSQSPASYVMGSNEEVPPDAIIDEYGETKTDTFYVGGTNLNIRLSAAFDSFIVGYLARPVVSPDGAYESWIAREQPAVIVIHASMIILHAIGMNDAANRLKELLLGPDPRSTFSSPLGGEYMLLKQNNLKAAGV